MIKNYKLYETKIKINLKLCVKRVTSAKTYILKARKK